MNVASAPLFIAYVAFPASMLLSRIAGINIPRNWIDGAWVFLLFIALAIILTRKSAKIPRFEILALLSLFFLGLTITKFLQSYLSGNYDVIPLFMTLKPIFYFMVVIAWVAAFGSVRKEVFITLGLVLTIILSVEFFYEWLSQAHIVRPRGSGEINYDAFLLLLSWVLSSSSTYFWKRLPFLILTFGLLICFSRTALVGAALALFLGKNVPLRVRLSVLSLSLAFIVGSFIIRGLPLDSLERADRLWMWFSAVDVLTQYPVHWLTGFPLGQGLPIEAPKQVAGLWITQAEAWGVSGVFSFNFHSFWLRFILDWGGIATVIVGSVFGRSILRSSASIVERRLALVALVGGLTMGLFYLSNVGVPLFLACILFFQGKRKCIARLSQPKHVHNCVGLPMHRVC